MVVPTATTRPPRARARRDGGRGLGRDDEGLGGDPVVLDALDLDRAGRCPGPTWSTTSARSMPRCVEAVEEGRA